MRRRKRRRRRRSWMSPMSPSRTRTARPKQYNCKTVCLEERKIL